MGALSAGCARSPRRSSEREPAISLRTQIEGHRRLALVADFCVLRTERVSVRETVGAGDRLRRASFGRHRSL
jgi:hypothetical protein